MDEKELMEKFKDIYKHLQEEQEKLKHNGLVQSNTQSICPHCGRCPYCGSSSYPNYVGPVWYATQPNTSSGSSGCCGASGFHTTGYMQVIENK